MAEEAKTPEKPEHRAPPPAAGQIIQIQLVWQPSHEAAPFLVGLDGDGWVWTWDHTTKDWKPF